MVKIGDLAIANHFAVCPKFNIELLSETLDFLKYLKTKKTIKPESKQLGTSTGKSLLEHLKTLDNWKGDDLEECYQAIRESRSQAKFDDFNPFDEK